MSLRRTVSVVLLATGVMAAGCGSSADPVSPSVESSTVVDDQCAHVIAAEFAATGSTYRISVTVRSADTGWDKYADAWEVRTTEGEVLGVRELLHPHEDEQPFTRSLDGLTIPAGVTEVVIAARDSVLGFCGETLTVSVPG